MVLFSSFSGYGGQSYTSQLTPERICAMLSITLCGQDFEESEWDENFKRQAHI